MAADIAPELLATIQATFENKVANDKTLARILQKIGDGAKLTYAEANIYAELVGDALSASFTLHCTPEMLPDGVMYYNIADRVVRPMLTNNYELVADVAEYAQNSLNESAGIKLKAKRAELNADRTQGIVDKVSSDKFEKTSWVLGEPVVNYTQSVVDDTIKKNVEFHYDVGFRPRITRKLAAGCCEWCADIAGEYKYPNVPDDFYRRHEYCRCTVIYNPSKGKFQNAHSKRTYQSEKAAEIDARIDRINALEAAKKAKGA